MGRRLEKMQHREQRGDENQRRARARGAPRQTQQHPAKKRLLRQRDGHRRGEEDGEIFRVQRTNAARTRPGSRTPCPAPRAAHRLARKPPTACGHARGSGSSPRSRHPPMRSARTAGQSSSSAARNIARSKYRWKSNICSTPNSGIAPPNACPAQNNGGASSAPRIEGAHEIKRDFDQVRHDALHMRQAREKGKHNPARRFMLRRNYAQRARLARNHRGRRETRSARDQVCREMEAAIQAQGRPWLDLSRQAGPLRTLLRYAI